MKELIIMKNSEEKVLKPFVVDSDITDITDITDISEDEWERVPIKDLIADLKKYLIGCGHSDAADRVSVTQSVIFFLNKLPAFEGYATQDITFM